MGFKKLDPEDLVISTKSVTATVWSNNTPTLTAFYTSSAQVASNVGQFYYSVYQTKFAASSSAIQFDIAYCHVKGSGSEFYNNLVTGSSPTKTNYGQYRNLILGDETNNFIFGNYSASDFYVLNVERARYKEKFLKGTMTLTMGSGSGTVSLTDDSQAQSSVTYTDAGRVYNMVSGSAGTIYTGENSTGWAGGSTAASGSYGWFLPDVGMILLNSVALDGAVADGGITLNTSRSFDSKDNNPAKIFASLNSGSSFTLNSEETLSSDVVFVRGRNYEFNYSENPSFISGSTGAVVFDTFIDNPQTYVTTVGLYNDNNELLSVAKLSRPLRKDFVDELLLRVKLDF